MLRVDGKTIDKLAKRGEPPGFKVAGAWRFVKEDIDRWIQMQKTTPRSEGSKEQCRRT